MLKIEKLGVCILVIPHEQQRYDTVGDWWFDKDSSILEIRVSELGNYKQEMIVALHEFIEAILCLSRGIKEEDVTTFDRTYEQQRLVGDTTSEPGDSIAAPYYNEHQFATAMEKFMAKELELEWGKYEEKINSLDYPASV